MSDIIHIRYEGMDAENHMLDLRDFGHAAIGLHKICNTGLIAISDRRIPKRSENFPLRIVAQEPKKGSFEWAIDLAHTGGAMLPLAPEFINIMSSEVLWRWIAWVTNMTAGKEEEADPHFLALSDLMKKQMDRDERLIKGQQEFFLGVLDRVIPAAQDFVQPVGNSVDRVLVSTKQKKTGNWLKTIIDKPMADEIKKEEKLEIGDTEQMRLRVDGLTYHNTKLNVENPEKDGAFMTAEVIDSSFSNGDNVYIDALSEKSFIDADVKLGRTKDGTLKKIYIIDAKKAQND